VGPQVNIIFNLSSHPPATSSPVVGGRQRQLGCGGPPLLWPLDCRAPPDAVRVSSGTVAGVAAARVPLCIAMVRAAAVSRPPSVVEDDPTTHLSLAGKFCKPHREVRPPPWEVCRPPVGNSLGEEVRQPPAGSSLGEEVRRPPAGSSLREELRRPSTARGAEDKDDGEELEKDWRRR
jgi:hypothetical protein